MTLSKPGGMRTRLVSAWTGGLGLFYCIAMQSAFQVLKAVWVAALRRWL